MSVVLRMRNSDIYLLVVQSLSCVWLCNPNQLQCARLSCPSLSPWVCSNSCPQSQWCYLTISSSAALFSSCLPSFPTSWSFPVNRLFTSGGQSIGASASSSILPMNIQGWLALIDCFDLLAVKGTLKSLLQHHNSKASVLQLSDFFTVQLSYPYTITRKIRALSMWTFALVLSNIMLKTS